MHTSHAQIASFVQPKPKHRETQQICALKMTDKKTTWIKIKINNSVSLIFSWIFCKTEYCQTSCLMCT